MMQGRPLGLSAETLIEIWEQGAGWHPIDQALLVLRYACVDLPGEDLSEWSIGRRDRRLLEIRRQTFGDRIEGYVECPACRHGLECELSCDALLAQEPSLARATGSVEYEGRGWEVRVPNSRDLSAVAEAGDVAAARDTLFDRCVRCRAEPAPVLGRWPESLRSRLDAELVALDPLSEILIELTCQTCSHVWQTLFDIVTYLWSEIRARSRRLLQEIDLLARTYGWTEQEVLRMSERRRGLYVQMALS